jgi:NDP-sugar pyrophosphorylase family protein
VVWLNVLGFALLLALPAIPSMFELLRPQDDGKLAIANGYVRDPRFFGASFRRMLAPFLERADDDKRFATETVWRDTESIRFAPHLLIEDDERVRGVLIGDDVRIGDGAGIRDAFGREHVAIADGAVVRTAASDGTLTIGAGVRVLRWIDAEGDIVVGEGSVLGASASSAAGLELNSGVRFERAWGRPVRAFTNRTIVPPEPPSAKHRLTASVLREDVIEQCPIVLEQGARVNGSLKVYGDAYLEAGVHVRGHLIAQGSVYLGPDARVDGNIFAEGDVILDTGAHVGAGGYKTVYCTGIATLADGVTVDGWIVAEGGGTVA